MSSVKNFDTVDARKEQLIFLIDVIKIFSLRLVEGCFLTIPCKIQNFLAMTFLIHCFLFFPLEEFRETVRQNQMKTNDFLKVLKHNSQL